MSRLKLVIFGFCLFLALSTLGSSLTFTGIKFDKEVSPGEEISHTITISLSGNETSMEAIGGVYDYGMGLDGTRIPRENDSKMAQYSAVGFLTLTPKNATIEPEKPANFLLEGKIPDDVGSGGRYALVEIHTPPQGSGQVGIALAAIASIRLTISGTDLVEIGEITNFNVTEDGADAIFKNTGNHHFKARAEATLLDDEGNVVASAKAPLMSMALVPTASWLFNMPFENVTNLDRGSYTAEVSVIHENGTVLDRKEKTLEV